MIVRWIISHRVVVLDSFVLAIKCARISDFPEYIDVRLVHRFDLNFPKSSDLIVAGTDELSHNKSICCESVAAHNRVAPNESRPHYLQEDRTMYVMI